MTARPDRDAVRAALSAERVLEHFGVAFRRRGLELRFQLCPACGVRTRPDSVAIDTRTGAWLDHAHGCRGDLLALVAGLGGFEVRRDFVQVLELAAEIAGVQPSERAGEVRPRPAQPPPVQRAEWTRDTERVRATWAGLPTRHPYGERYLRGRGLDPGRLRCGGDVVRFSLGGEPAVALRDLVTGDVVGVQYRAVDGREQRLRAERGSRLAGAALVGRVADLDPNGVDVAVLVEGLADALAASLAGLSVYSLRNTFNSLAHKLGADGIVLRDIMGHSDAAMTERYKRTEHDEHAAVQARVMAAVSGALVPGSNATH